MSIENIIKSVDNPQEIWAHRFFVFFAAGGMAGAVSPPGCPR